MKISYNWLKQYISVDLSPEEIADMLTGCGLEVEGTERWHTVKGGLDGVVVGEVLECIPHPGSDHLSLTRVSVGGTEVLPIVCGAPNVAAGQKVAVARIGAKLFPGDDEVVIKHATIRGEGSEGMICSERELGLGPSQEGIMVLDPSAVAGTPARNYFGVTEDVIYQIGLTPNRSDAACHLGIARDLVAVFNNCGRDKPRDDHERARLMIPDVGPFRKDHDRCRIEVVVEDTKGSPRYSGLTMTNVQVGESPQWLKERLLSVGLRPINNVVDITNFVMMELGQPLHAFDAGRIEGGTVIVKKFSRETPFVTLDEAERVLTPDDLMICDKATPMCIAGVFGGAESGVTGSTRTVFLESACFDPISIRKTARHHGLHTDASFRFERGTDIEITPFALKRAALLIKEVAGGEVSSELVDVYPNPREANQVNLSYPTLTKITGQEIPETVVRNILADLEIRIEQEGPGELTLRIPPFKVDVTREADVIEEVLRIYGYNHIGIPAEVKSTLSFLPGHDPGRIRTILSDLMSHHGFYELMNNSLTTSGYYEKNHDFPVERCVRILNPSSRDLDVMRQTLLYGGLESIVYNLNRKAPDLLLYEIGSVYSVAPEGTQDPLPGFHEEQHLAIFMTGRKSPEGWDTDRSEVDLFHLKSLVEAILARVSVDPSTLHLTQTGGHYLSNGIDYQTDKAGVLVTIGSLRNTLLAGFDIRQPVLYADLHWDLLLRLIPALPATYRELPKFPLVRRDLALLLDQSVTFEKIKQVAFETEKRRLRHVGLFDVYEGDRIEAGKKSYAVNLLLGDDLKTLTDAEIDLVMERLVRAFATRLGAVIR